MRPVQEEFRITPSSYVVGTVGISLSLNITQQFFIFDNHLQIFIFVHFKIYSLELEKMPEYQCIIKHVI